jgi:hypothetical protein
MKGMTGSEVDEYCRFGHSHIPSPPVELKPAHMHRRFVSRWPLEKAVKVRITINLRYKQAVNFTVGL